MGKKAAKKINRKIKRSARKTIGILTLIMAIIVAAIPVPSASAVGGTENDAKEENRIPAPKYPTDDKDITMESGVTLTPNATDKQSYNAQLIYKSGDYYYLYNIFKYYLYIESGSTNSHGCISEYDNSYVPEGGRMEIPQQVKFGYPSYTKTQVLNYFTTNSSTVLSTSSQNNEMALYYPDEWEAYEENLAAWAVWNGMSDDEKDRDPNKKPTVTITKPNHTIGEFLISGGTDWSDGGSRYFCSHQSNLEIKDDQGYMLVEVIDGNKSTGSHAEVVYMPCNVGGSIGDGVDSTKDYSGNFYVPTTNTCEIRYIGNEAFKGATSIEELVIPDYITIIGNDAFSDCSNIRKITAWSGTIGNRAFKNCAALQEVTLGPRVTQIGTECFYGCNSLKAITFPDSVGKVGFGAFAACSDLTTVDMSGINVNTVLADYCFFNCPSINSVSFGRNTKSIGYAAFALPEETVLRNTGWSAIEFPDSAATLGDYVLYGRGNIKTVKMPAAYGSNSTPATKLGSGFFGNCYQLEWVEFPDNNAGSCGYVTFDTNAFIDVVSKDFYIRGPELNGNRTTASPRKSSWAAGITYVFKDGSGVDQYEVSTGTYRFAVDTAGVLTDCTLLNKTQWQADGSVIEVPATVGNKTVTGIGSDCFSSDDIKNNLRVLKIADGSRIESIADHAFEGYPKLETVYIGNSVNTIGTSAFENCEKLETVVFSTPSGGYQNFKIGTNAFTTNSDRLTFYGDIVEGYKPFDWAMDKDNWMDEGNRIRVCYCSGTPEHPNLKVLLNNNTNLVTLVGYPHYDQLDDEVRKKYELRLSGDANPADTELNKVQEECLQNVLNIVIPAGIESIDVKGYIESGNDNNVYRYLAGDKYYNTYRKYGLFNGYYGAYGSGDISGNDLRPDPCEFPEGSKYEQEPIGNDRIQTVTMYTVQYLPDRAFESCESLMGVALGSAMEDIGTAPFTGCTNLTSVGGNSKYFGENGIIYETNDTGLTIVECLPARGTGQPGSPTINAATDSKISQVTQINEGAFENCGHITIVNFKDATKLTQIPGCCFRGAENLMQVFLPESVDDIREEAFATGGAYLSVEIPAVEVDIADSAFDNVGSVVLYSYENSAVENYVDRNRALGKNIFFGEPPLDKVYTVQFWDYDGTVIPFVEEDGTKTYVQYVKYDGSADEPEHPTGRTDGYVFDKWDKSFTHVSSDLVIIALYKWGYPDTSPGVLPNSSPGASNNGTPTPTPGAGTPGAGTPGAGTPGAGTPGAGTPGASSDQSSNQRYRLTVENGSGDGTYLAGTSIVITADTPPSGQRFDRWTSIANDFNITSATSSITTITMPSHDLTIVANYTSGSGSSGSNGDSTNISTNTNGNGNSGGTTVDITKPGISDTGVASATVEGSTDNYVVKITDTAEARAAVEAALINEYGTLDNLRYFAMDISLYDETGTVKIADTSNLAVNITMPIPDELRLYAGNNQVAGVVNGSVLDKLSPRFTTINGVPCISFTATHFSPYTVYVDTSNLSAGVSDSTPKTGDLIHPKWFLAIALACVSFILLLKKDKKPANVKTA